ncbi:hypothetical protein ACQ4PT_027622 [Festuca glaucescens]
MAAGEQGQGGWAKEEGGASGSGGAMRHGLMGCGAGGRSSATDAAEAPAASREQSLTGESSRVVCLIMFGGLIAPILELKLGLGGTSYEDFIRNMYLTLQLSQVDPIVASFSGGAVGVISALMLVEVKNVRQQEKKRCTYCHGTGYLPCARCSASKMLLSTKRFSLSTTERCSNCSGAGKVMCPTCLCTGMAMASEHDPRIDPFD